jgi:nifR3 family TIM-barrel protein
MSTQPTFLVDTIPIHGDLILAPMAGFSDLPYRSICRELGSAMSYTEFINALEVLQNTLRLKHKLAYLPEERPVVFQIFDNDPTRLLEVSQQLQELSPDIIDVNMGCSVRRVSGRGAGAGLLLAPLKVGRIIRSLSRALEVPISAKIRLGWSEQNRNHLLIARIIEENGGALIAVHGRTKVQGYSGQADWDAIAEIKAAVSIPVVANGDVRTIADIERIKAHTSCDGVMIGRAAIGNPWIFARLDREQVPADLARETMSRHLKRMLSFYGYDRGLMLFRKHASRYLGLSALPREKRVQMLNASHPEEFMAAFEAVIH